MIEQTTHGAMGHWIDPSWWTNSAISHSSQCSMTGVTKGGIVHVKELLLLVKESSPSGSGLPLYLSDLLTYVQSHMNKNKIC